MSVTYGLTADGFVPKPLQVIRSDFNSAVQTAFGDSIDLGDKSVLGQFIGILSERVALIWELMEAVYSSQDPDKATGAALDALCALTGTIRPPASYSTVTLTLIGTPATVVASGSQGKTTSTGKVFATTVDATIASVGTWTTSTSYSVGDRVRNTVAPYNMYQCIVGGISGGTPVTGAGSDISDGVCHWKSIVIGVLATDGAVDVHAQAVDTGAIAAVAGDITTIVTPVFGLNQIVNLTDAAQGRDLATDEELRTLRQEELSGDGHSPPDAIRAALLKLLNIISVTVFYNSTDATDVDGMPPHSVEALVRTSWAAGDPLDQGIYDTLFANVAAGIATTNSGAGAATGTATDSQGVAHTVKFSRPTEVPIYAILNVTYDAATFPSDGATQIKDNITTWAAGLDVGRDAVSQALVAKAFLVDGVLDVPTCYIDTAPSPASSATITIGSRELATYDRSRITVNLTPGTP